MSQVTIYLEAEIENRMIKAAAPVWMLSEIRCQYYLIFDVQTR